ncbi:uncharacterized protein [Primulina eburnea]|uniref:uncharacterized protein n=1 Tax=Primulina eburnea TaxID=1245227 RepID=UPI003C6BEA65
MEGVHQLKPGKLVSMSEQELIDCTRAHEDQCCEGGIMEKAFEFILKNKGLTTEANYPYHGVDGTCNTKKAASHIIKIRGYRDPLSPFLFTLCLEVLSRSLKRTSRSAHFGFHPKCANLRITHLAYADDLLLLSRGDTRSVSMIMECLNNFGDMAGLRVNLLKSNIYMAAIDDRVRDEILQITGFSPGNLPFRYLGVPLAARNLRSSDYSKLVESIAAKFNSWPRQSLSYAGKIELVRSVVQGIECFWLSILPIPNCIIDSIHSLCRKFVWPTKHPPIAWVTLCKSIDDGGLGLKNLKCWNKALIAKTLWKIQMRKESLWIRWVNHFYSKVGGVWSWGWHKDESPLIKQLIAIRDEIVLRMGSVDAASTTLQSWFSSGEGIGKAYDFFTKKVGKWPWKPLLSRSCILPKHKFTLWLVAHSKLRTRDRLPYAIDKACILCDGNIESVDHLFFRCAFSIAVWTDIKNWLGMSKIMGSTTAVLRAYRNHYGGKSMLARLRASALAATVYHIWNARNRRMFDDEKPRIEDIVKTIKILVLQATEDFQFYSSGVFTGFCGHDLNHGVAAVGYGVTGNGTKYWWIIREEQNGEMYKDE